MESVWNCWTLPWHRLWLRLLTYSQKHNFNHQWMIVFPFLWCWLLNQTLALAIIIASCVQFLLQLICLIVCWHRHHCNQTAQSFVCVSIITIELIDHYFLIMVLINTHCCNRSLQLSVHASIIMVKLVCIMPMQLSSWLVRTIVFYITCNRRPDPRSMTSHWISSGTLVRSNFSLCRL